MGHGYVTAGLDVHIILYFVEEHTIYCHSRRVVSKSVFKDDLSININFIVINMS